MSVWGKLYVSNITTSNYLTSNYIYVSALGSGIFSCLWYIYIYITARQFHITLVKIATPAIWNRTCDMTIPPVKWRSDASWNPTCVLKIASAKWRSQMRFEIPQLRYKNRTCEVKAADAFLKRTCDLHFAGAILITQLRDFKTHLRSSLRRCDSHLRRCGAQRDFDICWNMVNRQLVTSRRFYHFLIGHVTLVVIVRTTIGIPYIQVKSQQTHLKIGHLHISLLGILIFKWFAESWVHN